jgi:VanZ family protein
MGMGWIRKYIPWVLLLVYWPALFVLTHLPKLPPTGVHGGDKVAHFIAYLVLTVLFWLARYGKCRPSLGGREIYFVLILMVCYGAVDELSQQLVPNRFADWLDWLSDSAGVVIGLTGVLVLRQWWHRLVVYWVLLFALTHLPTEAQPLDYLPEVLHQFQLVYLMAGYVVLTLLWWLTWCPGGRFVFHKTLFTSTLLVLPTYALLDEMVSRLMGNPFDIVSIVASVGGILLGVGCAAAFAQQHLTGEAESG